MKGDNTILKPYNLNGGEGIIKISNNDYDENELKELIKKYLNDVECVVAQEFIEDVKEKGDKRINVIGYEPVSAVLRLPAKNSYLCNIKSGGSRNKGEISEKDKKLIKQIRPFLEKNQLFWTGIDIIGPYLGEINVSSPGMLRRADILNKNTNL